MKDNFSNLNLSRLKACNQYWDEMIPTEQGRICSKCSNIIYDFRDKNLFEIAKIHAYSNEKICGLYSKGQLERRKPKNHKPKVIWWKSVVLGISSLISTKEVLALESRGNNKIELSQFSSSQLGRQVNHKKVHKNPLADSVVIYGNVKVIDGNDSITTPGINVMLKGHDIGVVSDFDGNYRLDLSDKVFIGDSITLIFSFIGFGTKEVTVEAKNSQKLDVVMTPSENQIIEFYVIEKQPIHRRIWFWLKSPFRK